MTVGGLSYGCPASYVPNWVSWPECPQPGSHILRCFCGAWVHVTEPDDHRHPDDIGHEADLAAYGHFQDEHPVRYWLWQHTGWRWPVKRFFG